MTWSKGFGVPLTYGQIPAWPGSSESVDRQPQAELSLHGKAALDLTLATPSLLSISETQQQLCLQLEFPHQENPEAVALRWDLVPGPPGGSLEMEWEEG